jgi:hypothetical protein
VLAVTAAMLVCSTVFVVLRLISRIGIVRRLGWDDHFMILAWVSGNTRTRLYSLNGRLIRERRVVPRVRNLICNMLWHLCWAWST